MKAAQPIGNDRLLIAFLITAAGTLLTTIVAITGFGSLLVLDRVLRDGPFLIGWCVAAAGYGYWPALWLAATNSPQPLRWITSIGVGFGVISLLTLGLGTLGWLNTTTAYALLAVGTILLPWHKLRKRHHAGDAETNLPLPIRGERAFALDPLDRPNTPAPRPSPQPSPRIQGERGSVLYRKLVSPIIFAWLPIVALGAIMLVADCVPPGLLWTDEPHGYDVVEYHLQVPREWYEAGKITPLDHNVFSYLPMNVEMHYLLAMHLRGGPWAGMYLAQAMNGVFIVVMILTLLMAVGWPAAIIAAAVPWLTMLGSICYVEAGQLMWATLAVVWLLRSGTYRTAMIAGICGGFACGAKLTSVPMLVLPLPIAMLLVRSGREGAAFLSFYSGTGRGGGSWSSTLSIEAKTSPHPNPLPAIPGEGTEPHERQGRRDRSPATVQHFIRAAIFACMAMLVFSPWLIRTSATAGNPLFPEAMGFFGRGPFTDVQQQRWERSLQPTAAQHSFLAHGRAFFDQLIADWRWGGFFGVMGIAAFIAGQRGNHIELMIVAGIQLLFWLTFTHLQGRFALLMLPIFAMAIGQIETRLWRRVIAGAAIVMCIAGSVPLLNRLSPLVGVLGVDNFKDLLPQQAAEAIDAGQPLALIGDAKAFWYQTPMNKLHYRTVFDVRATADQSATDHWLDPADTTKAVRIIDESELQRLTRTYYGLRPAP